MNIWVESPKLVSFFGPTLGEIRVGAVLWAFLLLNAAGSFAQTTPVSPVHPWHGAAEARYTHDLQSHSQASFAIDPNKVYDLAELVDLAEEHNPQTSVAWQNAKAQAAALGVAKSELYPTIAATASSLTDRPQVYLATRFFRQTISDFQVALDLNYTIFDFGGRGGRIDAAKAGVLAANFAFNDTHRKVIYQVEQAYYQLLNAAGQEEAARASLANAQAVEQAAEERLNNGLATLPDVLEARSATAQAEYELQSALGAEEIAQGNLATVLSASPTVAIRVQPLDELPIPDSVGDSVDAAIGRALEQRPDLLQQLAEIRAANGRVREARSAYYPSLNLNATPTAQAVYGLQQTFPWGYTAGLGGGLHLNLNWTVFDGGARRNKLAQAQANVQSAEAQLKVARDEIADQVWTAYSNLNTAFRQRQAATALLKASNESYDAALESYNYGLRNFLDVTAAQRTLAQARATDVFARTQVLATLTDLAFRTGDAIQPKAKRP